MKLYLAAGHGVKPNGVFDPGAGHGGLVEHDLCVRVVEACARALARSGVRPVLTDLAAGSGHDPNFDGAAKQANQFGADLAIEVHFNATPASSPTFGTGTETWVFPGSAATPLAERLVAQLSGDLGLRSRGVKTSDKLGWLKATRCPSALIEVAFLDGDHAKIGAAGFPTRAGEAIARAICAHHGVTFVAATTPAPPTDRYEVRLPDGRVSGRFATPGQVGTRVTDLIERGVAPVTVVPFGG